jgi:hypothetical protein
MDDLQGRRIVFLASLYNLFKFPEQSSVMMVLPKQFIQSITIVIPYFTPTMMEEKDTLATAKIISNCIPMTGSGPATIRIFDIHTLSARFFSQTICVQR